jgi:hydroxymethylpyrimidine pyrophosphatase-like HAD family hydrolase
MPELDYVKLVKEVGAPLLITGLMIWFFIYKIIPAQHKRDQEKDESFIKTINGLSEKAEIQAKLFAERVAESGREAREHWKQMLSDIREQSKEHLDQNASFLETIQNNHKDHLQIIQATHKDYKEETTALVSSIRADMTILSQKIDKLVSLQPKGE